MAFELGQATKRKTELQRQETEERLGTEQGGKEKEPCGKDRVAGRLG